MFIGHDAKVLIQSIDLFHDFAVSVEKVQALNRIRIYDFSSGKWSTIPFPESVYSAIPGGTPEYTSTTYRYSYQSLVTQRASHWFDQ